MSQLVEQRVPDLGDFHDVEVIEVLVKAGDRVEPESPLITLETDKATMDVPATAAGVVQEVKLRKGDRVSKDSLIAILAAAGGDTVRIPSLKETVVIAEAPAAKAPAAASRAARRPPTSRAARPIGAASRHRRGTGRLHGRLPRGRSRPRRHPGGPLAAARRRLPQCRLHPVEGAPARRARDRGGRVHGGARHPLPGTGDRPGRAQAVEEQASSAS